MDAWLKRARDSLVALGGDRPERLELTDDDVDTLLELARIAAHESGDRTNAPLLCYLVGRAAGLGHSLDELAEAVRRSTA